MKSSNEVFMWVSSYAREALRGEEESIFDLAQRHFTEEQWQEWLTIPLEWAASCSLPTLAQKLVKAGAGVGHSLKSAIFHGHEDLVNTLLVERRAYTGKRFCDGGDPPLHVAAAVNKPSSGRIMRALLQAADNMRERADKDAFNEVFTPLQVAAKHGHAAQVGVLLSAGADPTIRCGQPDRTWVQSDAKLVDLTALDVAATLGHVEVLRVMLDHGVDPNLAHNPSGSTALHRVADAPSGRVAATKLLVDAGVDVNKQTVHGETALHWAAVTARGVGSSDAVDALLRCGADETLPDIDGAKAVDIVGCAESDIDDDEEDEVERDEQELKRVESLLMNAPADRAWRRRGMLVLCRAYPDRSQLRQTSSQEEEVPDRKCVRAKVETAEPGGPDGGTGDKGGAGEGVDWGGIAARLIVMKENDIFSLIIGYL